MQQHDVPDARSERNEANPTRCRESARVGDKPRTSPATAPASKLENLLAAAFDAFDEPPLTTRWEVKTHRAHDGAPAQPLASPIAAVKPLLETYAEAWQNPIRFAGRLALWRLREAMSSPTARTASPSSDASHRSTTQRNAAAHGTTILHSLGGIELDAAAAFVTAPAASIAEPPEEQRCDERTAPTEPSHTTSPLPPPSSLLQPSSLHDEHSPPLRLLAPPSLLALNSSYDGPPKSSQLAPNQPHARCRLEYGPPTTGLGGIDVRRNQPFSPHLETAPDASPGMSLSMSQPITTGMHHLEPSLELDIDSLQSPYLRAMAPSDQPITTGMHHLEPSLELDIDSLQSPYLRAMAQAARAAGIHVSAYKYNPAVLHPASEVWYLPLR